MTTSDALMDAHELTTMLINTLVTSRQSKLESKELQAANAYLFHHLMHYKALLRKRPLVSCYEFLTPPADDGRRAGWYWRHPKHEARSWVNWHGPFASRKLAVENRLHATRRSGAPHTPLEVLERELFGS